MLTPRLRYRAIFISDLHLGSASCSVELVKEFLREVECQQLYLVGDIVDLWVSRRRGKWKQSHTNIIRTLLGKTKHGTHVFFTPGNHDAEFRKMNGAELGNLIVQHQFEHTTLQGLRLLVVHGDLFDRSVSQLKPIAVLGAFAHEFLTTINNLTNAIGQKMGKEPSDFSQRAKKRVKDFVSYFTSFPDRITLDAQRQGFDGVVCGHVHRPAFEQHEAGAFYINTGDWMGHCTALVEHLDGRLELIYWKELRLELTPGRALPIQEEAFTN